MDWWESKTGARKRKSGTDERIRDGDKVEYIFAKIRKRGIEGWKEVWKKEKTAD